VFLMYGDDGFAPTTPSGLQLFLDSFDSSTITKTYTNLVATGSGTIGGTSITASGTITNLIQAGEKLRIGGTDIYTVATASGTAITTVETLTATYAALSPMALDRASQWNDKSGMGNHATQATALKRPVYNPAQLNGQAVLSFDGANTLILPAALYTIPNGPSTWFAVGKRNAESGVSNRLISLSKTALQRADISQGSTAGQIGFQSRSGAGAGVTSTGNTNTNYQIITGFRSGTTQSISVNNGTAVTNTNGSDEPGIDGGHIGSLGDTTAYLTGGAAIFLLYNRALSAAEIVRVNRWLSQRTAIAIS
jgi:hypothetical protein